MICYRDLTADELDRALFASFQRKQTVTRCWRREGRQWVVRNAPFIDDWSEDDYAELIRGLKRTLAAGGLVYGAFQDGALKGFVSVEGVPTGSARQYMDMSNLHVSLDLRRQGIGRALFLRAADFARARGGQKLYISAHSAVETQAFYRSMGCAEALEYDPEHVKREPYDCQLEYTL